MRKLLVLVMALVLVISTAALADEVILKNGDRVSGKVIAESESSVTIETGYGKLTIPRSDIERVERVNPYREEYVRRLAGLAAKHRELAKWCEENNLGEEAEENLALALELENKLTALRTGRSELVEGIDLRVFDAVWEAVRDHFYDRETYNGCDWKAMRGKYFPRAKAAKTQIELYDVCNLMLGELNASHCYLWSPYVWRDHVAVEFQGKKSLQAGLEILKLGGDKYFVRSVLDGGPADKAGVKLGDELVGVDGKPPGLSARVVLKDGISTAQRGLFTLRTDTGGVVTLGLRRTRGGKVAEVQVKPGMTSMLEAARNSARVIDRGGKKLGYIHLWHFMNREVVNALRDAVDGKLKDCDGLVLDIRGRGGSAWVIRQVLRVFSRGRWSKPAVVLVDEDTSSAKEIFAHYWKKGKLGPVVGKKTPGHVLGSTCIPMPDSSMLLLARTRVSRITRGEDLEGKGVEPDVTVKQNFEYCGGKDPIIETGMEELLKSIKRALTEPLFTPCHEAKKAA